MKSNEFSIGSKVVVSSAERWSDGSTIEWSVLAEVIGATKEMYEEWWWDRGCTTAKKIDDGQSDLPRETAWLFVQVLEIIQPCDTEKHDDDEEGPIAGFEFQRVGVGEVHELWKVPYIVDGNGQRHVPENPWSIVSINDIGFDVSVTASV